MKTRLGFGLAAVLLLSACKQADPPAVPEYLAADSILRRTKIRVVSIAYVESLQAEKVAAFTPYRKDLETSLSAKLDAAGHLGPHGAELKIVVLELHVRAFAFVYGSDHIRLKLTAGPKVFYVRAQQSRWGITASHDNRMNWLIGELTQKMLDGL